MPLACVLCVFARARLLCRKYFAPPRAPPEIAAMLATISLYDRRSRMHGHASGDASFITDCEAVGEEEQAAKLQNTKLAASSQSEPPVRGGLTRMPMLMINAAALMLARAKDRVNKERERRILGKVSLCR